MIMIFVTMESYDKGLLENTSYVPVGEIFVKNWGNRDFFLRGGGQILKFHFFKFFVLSLPVCILSPNLSENE